MDASQERLSETRKSEQELCATCGATFPTPDALVEHQNIAHQGGGRTGAPTPPVTPPDWRPSEAVRERARMAPPSGWPEVRDPTPPNGDGAERDRPPASGVSRSGREPNRDGMVEGPRHGRTPLPTPPDTEDAEGAPNDRRRRWTARTGDREPSPANTRGATD
jgi:hypothetical protein